MAPLLILGAIALTVLFAIMNWGIYQPHVRIDPRAEREEYARLYLHPARVLQDRMARRGHTDRTRRPEIPEWEKVSQMRVQARKLLYDARVLAWGKGKRYYLAHIRKAGPSLHSG